MLQRPKILPPNISFVFPHAIKGFPKIIFIPITKTLNAKIESGMDASEYLFPKIMLTKSPAKKYKIVVKIIPEIKRLKA